MERKRNFSSSPAIICSRRSLSSASRQETQSQSSMIKTEKESLSFLDKYQQGQYQQGCRETLERASLPLLDEHIVFMKNKNTRMHKKDIVRHGMLSVQSIEWPAVHNHYLSRITPTCKITLWFLWIDQISH